jgi:hypothetical protein
MSSLLDDDSFFEHLIETYANPETTNIPRTRNRGNNVTAEELENSSWGQLINSPDVGDPSSRNGKKFRTRFRTPFPLFEELLVPMCIQYNVFKIQRQNAGIPVKFRVLIGLRYLARAHDSDTMEELSGVKRPTCHTIFHQFLDGMVEHFFDMFVTIPKGDKLKKVMEVYKMLGFNGCFGSIDCTHIFWKRCPKKWTNYCTGKEKCTTLSFQVAVDHDKRIIMCSGAFFGAANDKLIVKEVRETRALLGGSMKDILFSLYDASGNIITVKGAYLITDAGFLQVGAFMDPRIHSWSSDDVRWAEFLESIRKDVECLFGILKNRFRFLWGYNESKSYETIEKAFKTCCILHNMILDFDRGYHEAMKAWENVDWSTIDPDVITDDELAEVVQSAMRENTIDVLPFLPSPDEPTVGEDLWIIAPSSKNDHFLLKDLLIASFNYQLRIGQVYWPRRFEAWQKDCHAIQKIQARIAKEVFNALYSAPSNYVDRQGESLGEGLFSTISFVRGDVIAEFHGDTISYEEYLDLELTGMHRFVVRVKENVYLDCRRNRFKGRCKASLANSPLHAVHVQSGVRALANCSLTISGPAGNDKLVTLQCSAAKIDRNTEIMWSYGSGHRCIPSIVDDDVV